MILTYLLQGGERRGHEMEPDYTHHWEGQAGVHMWPLTTALSAALFTPQIKIKQLSCWCVTVTSFLSYKDTNLLNLHLYELSPPIPESALEAV